MSEPVSVTIGHNPDNARVVMQFDRPIDNLNIPPGEVVAIAQQLLTSARTLDPTIPAKVEL